MAKIFSLLESFNLTSEDTAEVLSNSTRDVKDLKVYKDSISDLIFIDDHYVGDFEYKSGEYRAEQNTSSSAHEQDRADSNRRKSDFFDFYNNKIICDFGCGEGTFLKEIKEHTKQSYGIELQEDYKLSLNKMNIKCLDNINDIDGNLDTVFLFHVLEHLEEPIFHLESIRSKLADNGKIVIEVPHARDLLIKKLNIREFIDFTLWSQHLILHTRESLNLFLEKSGYKNINIHGVQRFSLANHIQWIKDRKPGGHDGELKDIETLDIKKSYQEALNKIDSTDTLIATAEKN